MFSFRFFTFSLSSSPCLYVYFSFSPLFSAMFVYFSYLSMSLVGLPTVLCLVSSCVDPSLTPRSLLFSPVYTFIYAYGTVTFLLLSVLFRSRLTIHLQSFLPRSCLELYTCFWGFYTLGINLQSTGLDSKCELVYQLFFYIKIWKTMNSCCLR